MKLKRGAGCKSASICSTCRLSSEASFNAKWSEQFSALCFCLSTKCGESAGAINVGERVWHVLSWELINGHGTSVCFNGDEYDDTNENDLIIAERKQVDDVRNLYRVNRKTTPQTRDPEGDEVGFKDVRLVINKGVEGIANVDFHTQTQAREMTGGRELIIKLQTIQRMLERCAVHVEDQKKVNTCNRALMFIWDLLHPMRERPADLGDKNVVNTPAVATTLVRRRALKEALLYKVLSLANFIELLEEETNLPIFEVDLHREWDRYNDAEAAGADY